MIINLRQALTTSTILSYAPKHVAQGYCAESLNDLLDALTQATTESHIHGICSKAREKYGFDYFSLYMYMPNVQIKPYAYVMREFSNQWTAFYEKNGLLLDDPSIPIILSRVTPSVWIPGRYETLFDKQQKVVANQAFDFGLRELVGFPIRGPDGSQFALRFHKQLNGLSSPSEKQDLLSIAEMTLLSSHVYETLQNILKIKLNLSMSQPTLTAKELEVLQWAASGFTSWAIANKLFMSENTVLKHLKNIHKKFGVHTRQHAIAKAVAMGLIQI